MKASETKVGERYLSKTGATVTKTGEKDGKIVMRLASGIVFRCGPDYELKPIIKVVPLNIPGFPEEKPPRPSSLAAIIAPMLLSGGYTVKEIAAELAKQAGDAAKNKDLEANVLAGIVSYTRKGWQVVKDNMKRVKVIRAKH